LLAGEVLLAVGERGMCICSAGDRSWRGEAWAQGVVGDRLKDLAMAQGKTRGETGCVR
jgi:hypothetical protein